MRVLVVGSGGREHALAWKLAQGERVDEVYVAPGNAGTAAEASISNVSLSRHHELLAFAQQNHVDLTVVGPEAPLAKGFADLFLAAGLHCFGPTAAAARLESSKIFAKEFMLRVGIPTAPARSFSDLTAAKRYLDTRSAPIVIKADGLAAGKGVIVAGSDTEAHTALDEMLGEGSFGAAGKQVLIEDFIDGEELSFMALCDGHHAVPLASSRDYKRRFEHDVGPNTGGMGAYTPSERASTILEQRILDQVIQPTLAGMEEMGTPFCGFLYAGLMLGPDDELQVLEFNVRMGDPETQPLLMRMRSDLAQLCLAGCEKKLGGTSVDWDPRVALGVVMAADGYPGEYRTGQRIEGLPAAELAGTRKVFHAGTRSEQGNIVTAGGRVLSVVALGDNIPQARELAYEGVREIDWQGASYRTDIGR